MTEQHIGLIVYAVIFFGMVILVLKGITSEAHAEKRAKEYYDQKYGSSRWYETRH